jgi:putative N6-adenine-specific DNA methylase/tRNA (guanine6-N2)-methyltransferase
MHDHLVLGVQLNRQPLDRRVRRPRALRTALKPTVAAAMLRLVGASHGTGRLVDPMCGSGTLLIEARRLNPRLELLGLDWDAATIETARETLAANGVDVELRLGDARALDRGRPAAFDYIVSDPPYGVRQARRTPMSRFYFPLLHAFERALAEGGRIALIVLKRGAFQVALRDVALEVTHERTLHLGGLDPRLLLLQKKG